jgi:hypothetical protein
MKLMDPKRLPPPLAWYALWFLVLVLAAVLVAVAL